MSSDEDWITEDMDDYYLGTIEPEPEYVDFSYDDDDDGEPDPETGLTPKQQAYQDYLYALEVYCQSNVGIPWYARNQQPPQWEDFWPPVVYQQSYQPTHHTPKPSKKDTIESLGILFLGVLWVGALIWFFFFWLA